MHHYNKGGHSKYSIKVHLIFVTKYRKQLFTTKNMIDDTKQCFYDISKKYRYHIIEMETYKDHIHILLEYPQNITISEIVRQLKQYSTYVLWKYNEHYLSKRYWKRKIVWSDGYFACSIGQVSQSTIEKYIQSQG